MLAILQELRARLGAFEGRDLAREAFTFSRFTAGFPRGVLVELTGPGKTENVAAFLAENPSLRVAWVESAFSLLPSAFAQRGVNLEKIFFVEAGVDSAWAASTILRSQLFPIVVYGASFPRRDAERELRRFQLLAEKSASTVFVLGEEPLAHAWPIRLSLACAGRKLSVLRK